MFMSYAFGFDSANIQLFLKQESIFKKKVILHKVYKI